MAGSYFRMCGTPTNPHQVPFQLKQDFGLKHAIYLGACRAVFIQNTAVILETPQFLPALVRVKTKPPLY